MFASRRIQLKTPAQIAKMRAAGLVVAHTLETLRAAVAPGVSTDELDALAEESIRAAGAVPSFKGYHGYPASICSSVNEQVVHAIPAAGQVLREGDMISIDCGAVLDGWHGDAAITVPVGEVKPAYLKMARVAEDALWAGIAAARPGRRLGAISHAIATAVLDAGEYGIVEGYGGHGIGTEMHQEPHVLNYGEPNDGPKLRVGMALAIEPMITYGDEDTIELSDGWTVITRDRSVAVHVEHSIALCDDGVWVLTALDGGRERLGAAASSRAG